MGKPETDKYKCEIVNGFLKQFFLMIQEEYVTSGPEVAEAIVIQFLQQYVGTVILNSLAAPEDNAEKELTKQEIFQLTWSSYLDRKAEVQTAISDGFADAFQVFTNADRPEIICQIITLDDGKTTGGTPH